MSEWVVVFKAYSTILKLYHGVNKLSFEQWDDDEVGFVLEQQA